MVFIRTNLVVNGNNQFKQMSKTIKREETAWLLELKDIGSIGFRHYWTRRSIEAQNTLSAPLLPFFLPSSAIIFLMVQLPSALAMKTPFEYPRKVPKENSRCTPTLFSHPLKEVTIFLWFPSAMMKRLSPAWLGHMPHFIFISSVRSSWQLLLLHLPLWLKDQCLLHNKTGKLPKVYTKKSYP